MPTVVRDIKMIVKLTKVEVIEAIKARYPAVIDIRALPGTGIGVDLVMDGPYYMTITRVLQGEPLGG